MATPTPTPLELYNQKSVEAYDEGRALYAAGKMARDCVTDAGEFGGIASYNLARLCGWLDAQKEALVAAGMV